MFQTDLCRVKRIYTCLYLLFILLYSISAPVNAGNSDETPFYFVQISDTHFGEGNNLKVMDALVERINELSLDIKFVVHTGDLCSRNLDNEQIVSKGLAILNKLKVPIHYVPGNDDIEIEKLGETLIAYKKHFGELISTAEYEGIVFMFAYTEPLRESFTVENYKPLEQLKESLKRSKGKPVILFHHAPSVDNFYGNTMHEGWNEDIREKWIKLINKYNVKAVIAGHFHRDEHHWLGNVPLYVSSSVAENGGRQPTFRIYEYKNGKVGYRTQYLDEFRMKKPEIIEKEHMIITGLKQQSESSKKNYDALWKSFFKYVNRFKPLSIDSAYYGLNLMPDEDNKMTYIVGVAIEKISDAPMGYYIHIVPASKYALFETTVGTVGRTLQYIFNEWLPYSHYQFNREIPFFEKYPADTKEVGDPVYIYIPIN